jgi:hypothetical protein
VIAVICKYLEEMRDEKFMQGDSSQKIERAKAVASRAGKNEFNNLSVGKLKVIYNTFRVMNKGIKDTIETAYECIS